MITEVSAVSKYQSTDLSYLAILRMRIVSFGPQKLFSRSSIITDQSAIEMEVDITDS